MGITLDPMLWTAIAAWAGVAWFARDYIVHAGRLKRWIDANDPDLWAQRPRQPLASRHGFGPIERIVVYGGARTPGLPDDPAFRALVSRLRLAIVLCFAFFFLALAAAAQLPVHWSAAPRLHRSWHD